MGGDEEATPRQVGDILRCLCHVVGRVKTACVQVHLSLHLSVVIFAPSSHLSQQGGEHGVILGVLHPCGVKQGSEENNPVGWLGRDDSSVPRVQCVGRCSQGNVLNW